ncbi:DNA sulfur modification protein DndB [Kamptonema cortianum]|nr:DNA sulfur modification protein DndB [Kamptonema cortianum]MDL5048062.1 DNA sulfur modification protein DndB [Oscillatoria amoena NRMC-F 0135]
MPLPINLPALRGRMGDWIYYVALLPFAEVGSRIKKTDEVHKSEFLRDMLQRSLESRTKDIALYLKEHEQRFFNSIVVGVYGGEPIWRSIKISPAHPSESDIDQRTRESLGVLVLSGEEKLFAIDGQHRVAGIKDHLASLSEEELSNNSDELCCIFVAHSLNDAGNKRTRKLFSTLNRYAKPVSLTEIISLNEDDVVAITCRSLLENHPLFIPKGRVSLKKTKSLGMHDKKAFTSLIALYQFIDIYLCSEKPKAWKNFKTKRPSDDLVSEASDKVIRFWNRLVDLVPELKRVRDLPQNDPIPEKYRGSHGGDFLLRPIFFPILAECIKQAEKWGMTEEIFLERFSVLSRELAERPWRDVIWSGGMLVRVENQKLARDLILWMINADPREDHITEGWLKERYAKITKTDILKVELPKKKF